MQCLQGMTIWESKPLCTFLRGGNVHDYALYNLGHITF